MILIQLNNSRVIPEDGVEIWFDFEKQPESKDKTRKIERERPKSEALRNFFAFQVNPEILESEEDFAAKFNFVIGLTEEELTNLDLNDSELVENLRADWEVL